MRDLGTLTGLLPILQRDREVFASGLPGEEVSRRLREVLAPPALEAASPRELSRWSRDGIEGTVLSWDVGYGAATEAWVLRPAGQTGPLPGVVALHCHSGMKFFGKEKIADGPDGAEPDVATLRDECYGGVAFANELARRGYVVLVHDTFGWGSRRIPIDDMPDRSEHVAALEVQHRGGGLTDSQLYDIHAGPHEDAMAKLLGVLGTSWGGVVVSEDLLAIDVLASLPGVAPGGVGVVGLSGGGARSALATALSPTVRAAVVASMMASMPEILNGWLHCHTWMLMNPGLGRVADWPDIAAASRPRPLFVGYATQDQLFPLDGMRAADDQLRTLYADAGHPDAYRSYFDQARHSFGTPMQQAAWSFLDEMMAAPPS